MHVAFRADASLKIGSGHIMRCLTLALELRRRGHTITFLTRDLAGSMLKTIAAQGFAVVALKPPSETAVLSSNTAHAHWLEVSWEEDAEECREKLATLPAVDWLVTDHYALDKRWEAAVRDLTDHTMIIDDLADRTHVCEVLLDQNLYPALDKRYQSLVPADCRQLLGPKFTLLRREFTDLKPLVSPRRELHNILIFFGGVDTENMTLRAINGLKKVKGDWNVRVVVGASNPHKEHIRDVCTHSPGFEYFENVTNMGELILQSDLGIGAGGTATWERCYLGLPALTFSLALNQVAVNEAIDQYGAGLLVGDTSCSEDAIAAQLQNLLTAPETLRSMSERCLALMDAHEGCHAVVLTLENYHR